MRALPEDRADPAAANAAFVAEAERYALRYRCEDCAHVDLSRGAAACSLGYPNPMLTGEGRVVDADGNLTFCKYWELGEQARSARAYSPSDGS